MIRIAAMLLATAAATGHGADPAPKPSTPAAARLPGFAAALSEQPVIDRPAAWALIEHEEAWAALARTTPDTRQQARWDYARSLIGRGMGPDALAVLEVMGQDDPDLSLVPSWQLARGAALTLAGRSTDALQALGGEPLAGNAEACAWRMRVMAEAELAEQALAEVRCALPAINARTGAARLPFVLVAAQAAIDAHQPAAAAQWLQLAPERHPQANLLRGQAALATGDRQRARLLLDRVALSGAREQRLAAELSRLEAEVAGGALPPAKALEALDRIRFVWRGGRVEARALRLTADYAARAHDTRRALAAGATLFRYLPAGKDAAPVLARLQAMLLEALAPDSPLPIEQAAGLYWDYRDVAPGGAEGDLLVSRLAGRLQTAGLYARAAELLHYQLTQRTSDVAQGPLSARVASLYILAGRPDRALTALRETDGTPFPDEMRWERRRVEAAALHLLGRQAEVLAALQDVPDGDRLRAEIFWKRRDWASFVAETGPRLPVPKVMSDVAQAQVLRQAIALAMLGREEDLQGLRARYGRAFATLPTAQTFDVLTGSVGAIDPGALSRAMASLPAASPAGAFGDLIDAAPEVGKPG